VGICAGEPRLLYLPPAVFSRTSARSSSTISGLASVVTSPAKYGQSRQSLLSSFE
jgi:hypothetical protein